MGLVAFVPAAGEAAGPPMLSRKVIVPSTSSHGIPGGPAASPAAGTNVTGSHQAIRSILTNGPAFGNPTAGKAAIRVAPAHTLRVSYTFTGCGARSRYCSTIFRTYSVTNSWSALEGIRTTCHPLTFRRYISLRESPSSCAGSL